MSAKSEEIDDADEVCACCGIAGVDDVKLKDCNGGCDLVKYCTMNVRKIIERSMWKNAGRELLSYVMTNSSLSLMGLILGNVPSAYYRSH